MSDGGYGLIELADKISEVGITAILIALFVLIYLYTTKKQQSNFNKMMEDQRNQNKNFMINLVAQNKELTQCIIDSNSSDIAYDEKNIVEIFTRLNDILKNECKSTSKHTRSDRTAIYVFHNGSHSSHGMPFFKMSCICEWINKGATANTKLQEHTNMTLNLFEGIVKGLYNNGEYTITAKTEKDPSNLLFVKDTKIVKSILISIYDDNNNIMGFVVNDYNKQCDIDIDLVRTEIQLLCDKVKPVLQFSNYQENIKE